MADLAALVIRGLDLATDPGRVAPDVSAWRAPFTGVHFTADQPGAGTEPQ
jgi:glycine hydroxymethyltransferase